MRGLARPGTGGGMRVVVALGGNALLHRGGPADADTQRRNVSVAARAVAELADHQLVVTHGNGPQICLLALQSEAYPKVRPYPLDVLCAESEGMIGYLLDQALQNQLPDRQGPPYSGRIVARHERAVARSTQSLVGEHYLEVLHRKPGALPQPRPR
jgi:carbamate kinase